MIVRISSDAEQDVANGYWFYGQLSNGLGDYFRDQVIVVAVLDARGGPSWIRDQLS